MNTNKNVAACQTVVQFDVYAIWCRVTDQYYVGVTGQEVYQRIRQHKRGKKQFVDKEIRRIGWENNWDWWVVETGVPSDLITEREQYWVAFFGSLFPNGYNKTIGGIAHFKHSEKTCEQMRTSHLGKTREPFTDEHRAHISESRTGEKNPNYGKPAWNRGIPCPETAKDKIRKKLTGRKRPDQSERMKGENNPNYGKPLPEKTKAILRAKALERDVSGENNPMYGKHQTEEAKEAIRQANLGKPAWNKGIPCSEEAKANLREKALARNMSGENNPFYGKHHTEEANEKNRQAHLGKPSPRKGVPCPEETKAKLRAKALERDVRGERNPFYGKHQTPEAIERTRQANLGRPAHNKGVSPDDEVRIKMSASALARAAKKAAAEAEVAEAKAKAAQDVFDTLEATAAVAPEATAKAVKAVVAAIEAARAAKEAKRAVKAAAVAKAAEAKAEAAKAVVAAIKAAKAAKAVK